MGPSQFNGAPVRERGGTLKARAVAALSLEAKSKLPQGMVQDAAQLTSGAAGTVA